MTAHPHAEMIKAKAENMDLVVFVKPCENGAWYEKDCSAFQFWEDSKYFLCLPQHKEACLHWLNGGDVQQKPISDDNWMACADVDKVTWMSWTSFMQGKLEFRIKPRKEKRWIAVNETCVTDRHFKTMDKAREFVNGSPFKYSNINPYNWKFIEIEVEI